MKKQITTTVATLSLIAVLTAIGFAGLSTKLTADIPFDFNVGGKTMPAGKYTLTPGPGQNTVIVRNAENNATASIIVQNVNGKKNAKANVTFRRYGNQSFLAGMYDGLGGSGQELPKSKAERRAAQGKDNLAMKSAEPEIVTIGVTVGQ